VAPCKTTSLAFGSMMAITLNICFHNRRYGTLVGHPL
jgi:hypothetical protein